MLSRGRGIGTRRVFERESVFSISEDPRPLILYRVPLKAEQSFARSSSLKQSLLTGELS